MSEVFDQVSFREMRRADISAGLGLCRASRWNQLSRDWELFLQFSPNGCRVAIKDEQVVGTVTTVSYPEQDGQGNAERNRFSWVGMVMVDSMERRKGIGTRLLREALDILSDQGTIRLDATPEGREVYLKLGFVDEYRLSRMETNAATRVAPEEENPARQMTDADLPQVFEMDYQVFGADRSALLKWLFDGSPEYSWVIFSEGEVAGYTFGRQGFNFDHLGPVVAGSQVAARQLLSACLSNHPGRAFILDAPQHDPEWIRCLESFGFREQRPFIRMFLGENHYPGSPQKLFGILGPEFG